MKVRKLHLQVKSGAWLFVFTLLVSFAAGSLITARLMHAAEAKAETNRVFELMIYHTVPGQSS